MRTERRSRHAGWLRSGRLVRSLDVSAEQTLDRNTRNMASRRSVLSTSSDLSVLSAGSDLSVLSAGSILSFGSAGSMLSIGSAGSILSIGSAGSILSVGSAGSILSIGSVGSILTRARAFGIGADTADHQERRVRSVATLLAVAALAAALVDR